MRGRLLLYGLAGAAWVLGMIFAVRTHEPFEANLLRPPGGSPFVVQEGVVQNTLQVHLVNKESERQVFLLENDSADPVSVILPQPRVELDAGEGRHVPLLARVPSDAMTPGLEVVIGVSAEGHAEAARTLRAPILGPVNRGDGERGEP